MSEKGDNSPILAQWLKKKGSKFGFWHRRFCVLTKDEIFVYEKEKSDLKQRIKITPELENQLVNEEHILRLVITPPDDKSICLAADEEEPILNWALNIRILTLITPGLSIDDFEIKSILARGYYGKVVLAKKKNTEEYYAIKEIHKNRLVKSSKVHSIFVERNILTKTHHPFIINICFAFQTEAKVFLGLEYAMGGELFYQIQQRGKIPPKEVKMYIAELSMALNYLHNNHVIYSDLKPENVLIDAQGYVKLTDYCLAKIVDPQSSTFVGTSSYIAPEIASKRPYDKEIDWWALGVLTYELLLGDPPFSNPNRTLLFKSIINDEPKYPENLDANTKDFISMLLQKNPDQRAGFQKVLNHPFFDGLNFENVYLRKVMPDFVPPAQIVMKSGTFDSEFQVDSPLDSLTTPTIDSTTNDQFKKYICVELEEEDDTSSDVHIEDSIEDEEMKPTTLADLPVV